MRKSISVYLVIFILAISSCKTKDKVNTRPISVPLEGTYWLLTYNNLTFGERSYELEFLEDGKLMNHHPNESTPDNDRWMQKAGKVQLLFNDGFANYRGEFTSKKEMSGTATSQQGGEWEWKAVKMKKKAGNETEQDE